MNKKFYKYVNKKIFKILLNTIILVNIIIAMLLLQTHPAIIEGKKKDDDSIKLRQNDCLGFFLRNSRLAPSQSLTVERRASSRPWVCFITKDHVTALIADLTRSLTPANGTTDSGRWFGLRAPLCEPDGCRWSYWGENETESVSGRSFAAVRGIMSR